MIADPKRVYDGWDSLAAGMDAGRRPSLIEANQCAKARDVVFRGGTPKNRPGIRQLTLTFENNVYYDLLGLETGVRTVHDADIAGPALFSNTANFTEQDVGSVVICGDVPGGTTIISVESATAATMSAAGTTVVGVTLTIADRTASPNSETAFHTEPFQCASYYTPAQNRECIMATFGGRLFQITPGNGTARVREIPLGETDISQVRFVGSYVGAAIVSDNPVFTAADIGMSIEGGDLAPGTEIIAVTDESHAIVNDTVLAASDIVFTLHRQHQIGNRNRRTIKENFMVQADRWHITQDGESLPIIFDGVTARRAGPDEVIVGTIMAYGVGRLIVTRGNQIYFGDLFGSHEGDPSESVLKFTETSFLNEGFPASIPYIQGQITAAAFFPSQDTATGQGELVIFTESGAVSFDLHLPREKWKESTFQQISLINSTAFGNRAVVMVNSDLWIRSRSGWRAYRQARAQSVGWYQLPQSTEVSPWTDVDTPDLLRFGSAISFENRLIVTCNPVPNSGRLYHNGLLSLDFNVLSSFGQATRPAWDGHWGKLKTLQLVSGTFAGEHRAFAFGLDADNATQLYEISKNDREDFDGPITSEIEGRSHNFNAPFNEKNLYGADIWLDDTGPGGVSLELSFRPDSSATYLPWKTTSETLTPGDCGNLTCGGVPTVGVGFAPRIKIGKPSDACDEYTGRLNRRGYEFQPKLRWTGHASIRRMRLQAIQEEEDPKGEC